MITITAYKDYDYKDYVDKAEQLFIAYCVNCGNEIYRGLPEEDMEDMSTECEYCGNYHQDLWNCILSIPGISLFVRNALYPNDAPSTLPKKYFVAAFFGNVNGHGAGNYSIWSDNKDELTIEKGKLVEIGPYKGYRNNNGIFADRV